MLILAIASIVVLAATAYALYLGHNEDRRQEWRRISRATWNSTH